MVSVLIRHDLIVVKASPYPACVIRRIPHEPAVPPFRCRSGLSCRMHLSQINLPMRGSILITDYILHGACQDLSSAFLHHRPRLLAGVVKDHISILIQHLRIKLWLIIMPQICDRSICPCQIQIGNAPADPAQRQRLPYIRQDTGIRFQMVCQSRDPHLFCKIEPHLRCDLCQKLYSDNIDGFHDRTADGHLSRIRSSCVIDRGSKAVGVWLIDNCRCKRYRIVFNRGRIGCQDLEGRPGLAHRIRRTIQCQACILISSSAHQRRDKPVRLVNHNTGCLRLRRNCHPLPKHRVPFFDNRLPECLCIRFRKLRIRIHHIEGSVTIASHPGPKMLISIVRNRLVLRLDAQCIIDPDFCSCGKIPGIGEFLITDFLNLRILGGVDPKPAGIDGPVCLLPGISKLILQILHDLCDQRILIERIYGTGCIDRRRIFLNPVINGIRHRLIIS